MANKLVWDSVGEKTYETGTDRGVFYGRNADGDYVDGVAWNGLTAVSESPSGAESTPLYADNIKYINILSAEEFGATIEAYMSPPEFDPYDGLAEIAPGVNIGQQPRKTFGFCYRTILGNDISGEGYGYKLHLIYGAIASPSEKAYSTISDSPEPVTFSWEVTTTPEPVEGFKSTASIVIDSTTVDATKLAAFEEILYGVAADAGATPPATEVAARMPKPAEIAQLFAAV